MTKTAEPKAPDLGTLTERIGKSERDRDTFRVEQEELPGKLRQASYDGDVEAIVRYKRRLSELPDYIQATEIRLCRLRISALDLRIADAKGDNDALEAPIPALQEAADRAKDALQQAQQRAVNNYNQVREWQTDRRRYENEVARLMASPADVRGD